MKATLTPIRVLMVLNAGFLGVGFAGCGTDGTPKACGEITIQTLTDDANPTFENFTADSCAATIVEVNGGSELHIDVLHNVPTPVPRVSFVISLSDSEFVMGIPIDLTRQDDLSVPPAFYQEYDRTSKSGPFWSSKRQAGLSAILLLPSKDGTIAAAFQFEANNPSTTGNAARGELKVSGTFRFEWPAGRSAN